MKAKRGYATFEVARGAARCLDEMERFKLRARAAGPLRALVEGVCEISGRRILYGSLETTRMRTCLLGLLGSFECDALLRPGRAVARS